MRQDMWKSGLVACGLTALILAGCGGKAPQIPSQRKGQAPKEDSTSIALMELNMQLARAADNELTRIVSTQEERYALYDANVWMLITDRGNEDAPAPTGSCTLRMRTYSLDGKLLLDSEGTYTLGKNELPNGVEWNIDELHPGGKARMYVPWYMAYGQQGTEHVPPYENVIIEIEMR
jgi:hypothetical protein